MINDSNSVEYIMGINIKKKHINMKHLKNYNYDFTRN